MTSTRGRVVERSELPAALMGPVMVEVAGVVAEDLLGVAAVEEQEAVGAFLAGGADEALRVRVAVGAPGRDLGHGDPLA